MSAIRSRALPTAGLLVLATFVIMACGGSATSSNSSSKSGGSPAARSIQSSNLTVGDVCTLVTADEASAAVGTTVTNPTGSAGVIPGACFYTSADGSASLVAFAQAYPDASTADQIQPDQMAAGFQALYGIKNAKSVSGIGDKAFEYTATSVSGSSGIAIFVFKANVLLYIIMSPSTDSSKIEALAKAAIDKLHS